MPPAAPFLSAAKEMGERTPPKTNGFWISFRPNVTTVQKGPQRIASASTLAAAGVVGREHLRFYRFEQLSNHALAAVRVREVKITRGVKHFHCTERMEKFPLWNAGAAAGMGGRRFRVLPPVVPFLPAAEGNAPCPRARVTFGRSGPLTFLFYASGGSISSSSGRGMLRALGHGSLLAAAPKVTKNAA